MKKMTNKGFVAEVIYEARCLSVVDAAFDHVKMFKEKVHADEWIQEISADLNPHEYSYSVTPIEVN